jgi:hypothetical protein
MEVLKSSGYYDAMRTVMVDARLGDCGIKDVEFVLFPEVVKTDDETRRGYLQEVRRLGASM